MKKTVRIILILVVVLVGIVLLDTLQARLFDNTAIIHIKDNYVGGNIDYVNKGLLVDNYVCSDGTSKTVFKWNEYTCSTTVKEYSETVKEYSEFTRTYEVLATYESNDINYLWITIRAFQDEEVATVRIDASLVDIEVGSSYEFTLKPNEKITEDTTISVFNNSELVRVEKTDKLSLEQVWDSIPE